MRLRTPLLFAGLATAAVLLAAPAAYADSTPTVKPGGTCTKTQAQHHAKGRHNADTYECRETKPGCYLWKFSGHPTGVWTGGPAKCPACKPTPKPTPTYGHPTPRPSYSHSMKPSHSPTGTAATAGTPTWADTTPAGHTAAQLPVTGPSRRFLLGLLLLGFCFIAIGVAAVYASRTRRTET